MLGIDGKYCKIIKAIYSKPTANDVLNGGKQSISSKIWDETRILTLPSLIYIVLEVFAIAIRQEKDIKGMKTEKEVKISSFADDMSPY